jgi:hypothetical protein
VPGGVRVGCRPHHLGAAVTVKANQPTPLERCAALAWHIENGLDWVRDVTFAEDAS